MGQQAAKRGAKASAAGPQPSGSPRGGVTSPSRLTARGGAALPAPPPEQSDFRHAILAAQYQNMRQLGRDIPFGISMILNGHYRDILDEGQRPFDLFLDS
jgi:hypothetical protein